MEPRAEERKNAADELIEIPNIIHFIWHGGVLSGKRQERVEAWCKQNPDYKIYVWHDSTLLTETEVFAINEWARSNNITLIDTEDIYPDDTDSQYESCGPFPNYGARSDIERWKIVRDCGGIYLDTDISPGKVPLPTKLKCKYGFLLSQHSQGVDQIGNDIIAAAKENPFITYVSQEIENEYKHDKSIENMSLEEVLTSAISRTIVKSGSGLLRQILYDAKITKAIEAEGAILLPEVTINKDFFNNEDNDLSWLDQFENNGRISLPAKDYQKNPESFLQELAFKITYELRQFNLCLLRDYLACAPFPIKKDFLSEVFMRIRTSLLQTELPNKSEIPDENDNTGNINETQKLLTILKQSTLAAKKTIEQNHYYYAQLIYRLEKYIIETPWKMRGTPKDFSICLRDNDAKYLPSVVKKQWDLIKEWKQTPHYLDNAPLYWRKLKKLARNLAIAKKKDYSEYYIGNYIERLSRSDEEIMKFLSPNYNAATKQSPKMRI